MRVEPGIGWGEAKIGATMRELLHAFGRPTKTEVFEDHSYASWESQGLRVTLSLETETVEDVTLFGADPDEPAFTRARLEGSDVAFGMIEAAVIDALGHPTETFRSADKSWVRHVFPGLSVRLVNDAAVAFTIERDPDDHPELVPEPRNEALEAIIAANPDDRSAYLVYGDSLSQQGHARGALIAQHAAGTSIDREPAEVLLGKALARVSDLITSRSWRLGFLERATVASNFERSPLHGGEREHVPLSRVLAMLLDGLAGRFLRDLVIGISDFESNGYSMEMQVIGSRPRPLLRSLYVGAFEREETELNWSNLGDASPMWPALPNLRELTLRSGSMQLGEIALPELRTFATRTGGLTRENLRSIAFARWPKLEQLDLQIGSDGYGSDVELGDFDALLERLPPTVRHLGLTNTEHADGLVPVLAAWPALKQLETLDLSLGTLGEAGGEALLTQHARFAHLKKIDLSENWLDIDLVDRIREKLPQAVSVDQRDDGGDPNDRYIAAGE